MSGPFEYSVWTDSDWADERIDRISITGWITTLNGCPITWKSVKQGTESLSSTEAECYALTEGIRESLYLRQWLEHYFGNIQMITVKGDNTGSHKFADHPTDHEKTKHYHLKSLFCRSAIRDKKVTIVKVPSIENIADILTKSSTPKRFQDLKEMILS
jgi:hypothetical protein